MPLSERLLAIIVCPETHQRLAPAEPSMIAALEARRSAGTLNYRNGKPVSEPIDGGFLRADGKVLYPVIQGIPVLLVEESIPLEG